MKKNLLLVCVFSVTAAVAGAQGVFGGTGVKESKSSFNSGIVVSLGAAANYYYGPGSRNFDKYESERLNWQADGMLGLTVARSKTGKRTMLAAFGSFGMNNAATVNQILSDQGYTTAAISQNTNNNVYQLEGGLLIGEVFRISTGVGQQVFDRQLLVSGTGAPGSSIFLKYNSTTLGFNLNLSAVAIVLNCTFEYGRDFPQTVIKPSAGLMLHF